MKDWAVHRHTYEIRERPVCPAFPPAFSAFSAFARLLSEWHFCGRCRGGEMLARRGVSRTFVGMKRETIESSMISQLDLIEKSLLGALAVAIVVGWSGSHHVEPIEVIGIKTTRLDAFKVSASVFVVANIAILLALIKMGNLANLLDDEGFQETIEKVMTHGSLFNPFAYFGPGFLGQISNSVGWGLLIVCWWICFAAIGTLVNLSEQRTILGPCLTMAGVLSLLAMHRFQAGVLGRFHRLKVTYNSELMKTVKMGGWVATLAGIIGVTILSRMLWVVWIKPVR